ncbi:TetR/AcrR family transcriptional regulator [Williamsia deligens]|uniref:TetR/AcrR family transcriptional regulator n=1 Tax=Williamsia deligens TaxID=321325 RepID=A0ABW3GFP7_9NOCA|nr:TetR/AcrR family transcriptional regulator [Williamsia deligens]MCP2195112.1 transcriptional regulator, TetR family [Williamsia deligens]
MTRADPRRRVRRADVREAIIASARVVFAERGYDGASIDRVAEHAGFTKGAVYSNFSTKDELFDALIDAEIGNRIDAVTAMLGSERDAVALARAGGQVSRLIGDRLSTAMRADPQWQLLFLEHWIRTVRKPDSHGDFVDFRRRLRARIEESIRQFWPEDQRRGASVGDLSIAALALSNGLAIESMIDPDAVPDDLFGRLLAKMAETRSGA